MDEHRLVEKKKKRKGKKERKKQNQKKANKRHQPNQKKNIDDKTRTKQNETTNTQRRSGCSERMSEQIYALPRNEALLSELMTTIALDTRFVISDVRASIQRPAHKVVPAVLVTRTITLWDVRVYNHTEFRVRVKRVKDDRIVDVDVVDPWHFVSIRGGLVEWLHWGERVLVEVSDANGFFVNLESSAMYDLHITYEMVRAHLVMCTLRYNSADEVQAAFDAIRTKPRGARDGLCVDAVKHTNVQFLSSSASEPHGTPIVYEDPSSSQL